MRMFLYPAYVCLQSAKANSRSLFQALKDLGVEVEAAFWHGTLDSLPDDRPSIIRASSMMSCAGNELAQRCAQLGHFAFYNDSYLSADGTYKSDDLIETLTAFIEKNRQAAELTKQEVVDFLVSQPEGSSVDCGLYIERQAALLLKLWDEHVIAGKNSPTGSEFEDEYPQVTSRPDRQLRESASIPEHMGFAIQDIQSLVLALGQDTAKIKILKINVYGDVPGALAYKHKLRRGLQANLQELQFSSHDTAAGLRFMQAFTENRADPPLGVICETMKSRHSVQSASTGVRLLYRAMLPILLKKLSTFGYPKPIR